MGSELEPDEETIAALKDETEPVIKMKPVLRSLHPVSNVRPLLREDIERQKREARPQPNTYSDTHQCECFGVRRRTLLTTGLCCLCDQCKVASLSATLEEPVACV